MDTFTFPPQTTPAPRPTTYREAQQTLTSSWLPAVEALQLQRAYSCADPKGYGCWGLSLQSRAVLMRLVLRANRHYVAAATQDDFVVAGVPRNAQAMVLRALEARGFLRILPGAKGKRLFVLLEIPTSELTMKPEGWRSDDLHRSARAQSKTSKHPRTSRAIEPSVAAQLHKDAMRGHWRRAEASMPKTYQLFLEAMTAMKDRRGGRVPTADQFGRLVDVFAAMEAKHHPIVIKQAIEMTAAQADAELLKDPVRYAAYLPKVAESCAKSFTRTTPEADPTEAARRAEGTLTRLLQSAIVSFHQGNADAANALWPDIELAARRCAPLVGGDEEHAVDMAALAFSEQRSDWRQVPAVAA